MTESQRTLVTGLRRNGMGYKTIARKVGVSVNTVKSYCRRHEEACRREQHEPEEYFCQQCGAPVVQNPGRKRKKFCSDRCRNKWWNSHLDLVKRKANHQTICHFCGREFTVYGKVHRKYCSHACYIKDRFGGGKCDEGRGSKRDCVHGNYVSGDENAQRESHYERRVCTV